MRASYARLLACSVCAASLRPSGVFLFGGFFGDMLSVVSSQQIVLPAIWFNPMDDPTNLMIWSMIFGCDSYLCRHVDQSAGAVPDRSWPGCHPGHLPLVPDHHRSWPDDRQYRRPDSARSWRWPAGSDPAVWRPRCQKSDHATCSRAWWLFIIFPPIFPIFLSYTRILALVLATSVIAMVVNLMGFLLGPTIPGILVFIVVAVAGHGLNLALSTFRLCPYQPAPLCRILR